MGRAHRGVEARERLERMFADHADQVYAFARHRLEEASAEDVVSETFLAAWRRIDDIREPALPWLLAAARRLVANELRGRRRQSALADRLTGIAATDLPESARTEDHLAVLAALRTLSETDQEVLVVSTWYDLDGRQAAQVLGCSAATYAVRLHRARRRLRNRMIDSPGDLRHEAHNDQEAQT